MARTLVVLIVSAVSVAVAATSSKASCLGVEGSVCAEGRGRCGCYSYFLFNNTRLADAECNRPLGLSDSGRSLSLRPGQAFQVELEGNPTTGYQWYNVLSTDGQHGYTRPVWPVASQYVSSCPSPSEGRPAVYGCGGVFTYTFRVGWPSKLRMVYSHAHQKDIAWEFNLTLGLKY
eukprot:m51a1_g3603 hypothetical protein (175) ;mRNA; f:29895-30532